MGQRKPQGHIYVQGQAYPLQEKEIKYLVAILMNSTISTLMVNLWISINFYSTSSFEATISYGYNLELSRTSGELNLSHYRMAYIY